MSGLSLDEITELPGEENPEPETDRAEIDADLHARWLYAHGKAKEWADTAKELRGQIEVALGEREFATVEGKPVIRWYYRDVRRFSQARLREDHPEIIEAYTETARDRRFEVIDG